MARIHRRGPQALGLAGVSVAIGRGESVALLGATGSGKTTLLRTLAGVLIPDKGACSVDGHVASLLSVGAGVMSELTGRENAYLLGVLAGLSGAESQLALEEIKEWSCAR